jgi:hypothetical protein
VLPTCAKARFSDAEDSVARYLEARAAAQRGLSVSAELEGAFILHARWYGAMTGVTRQAWIVAGVGADVLDRAGI